MFALWWFRIPLRIRRLFFKEYFENSTPKNHDEIYHTHNLVKMCPLPAEYGSDIITIRLVRVV